MKYMLIAVLFIFFSATISSSGQIGDAYYDLNEINVQASKTESHLTGEAATTDPLDTWKLKVKASEMMSVPYGVAYGNGVFVSVGKKGIIHSSPSGSSWTRRKSGTSENLWAVSFLNSAFFAVGDKGTILSSIDGKTWSAKSTGFSGVLYMITYGSDKYVAIGDSILVSTDGNTWTEAVNPGFKQLYGVARGEDKFVAVGISETSNVILNSADGLTWTLTDTSEGFLYALYAADRFILAGINSVPDNNGQHVYGAIYSSDDGVSWEDRTSEQVGVIYGLAYGDNIFLAVGKKGTLLTSLDGVTWTKRTLKVSPWFLSAAYGDGTYVAVSSSGIYKAGSSASGGLISKPKISITPQKLDVGSTTIGNPLTGNIAITNIGTAGLVISQVTFGEGLVLDFSVSHDCAGLAPSESCSATVTFSPLADSKAGKVTKSLIITSNDPKTAVSIIPVSGTIEAPRISAKNSSVRAGTLKVGRSVTKSLKISNKGSADLVISSIGISGTNSSEFLQTSDCTIVSPREACDVSITFTAVSAGQKTAMLSITSNDPKSPELNVKVTGKGKL